MQFRATTEKREGPVPPATHSSPGEGPLDLVEGLHGAPALGNEAALSHVQVEHVEGMVDGLDLLHLNILLLNNER